MIDWALDQFSEGAIWALVVLGVIAVVVGVIEAVRFFKIISIMGAESALPLKADMCSATRYVRFAPVSDIGHAWSQREPRTDDDGFQGAVVGGTMTRVPFSIR
jgi:hypothetical protein